SLTGALGVRSSDISDLFKSGSLFGGAGGDLLAPIFTGGALEGNYEAAVAQWNEAKAAYEQSALNAFREVADALSDLRKLAEVRDQETRQVAAYAEAVRLSTLRYEGGLSSYLEVLDAQRQLYSAEIALAQTRGDEFVALVRLYRALGGGWQLAETEGA